MIAREWVTGFPLTRRGADLLKTSGSGRESIVQAFCALLASEPDTFIIKEHGTEVAQRIVRRAREVLDGKIAIETFDAECIEQGINPGSIADIIIAALYIALGEGWEWDS
jgi:triphosphoribosyl-dephospho-CoA synthase